MKFERSDIEFPIWRKKVDATIFKNASTPIPKWLWKVWDVLVLFENSTSKENPESSVQVLFDRKTYSGRVIHSVNKELFRLFFDRQLSDVLKDVFLMSYMRSIEQDLRKNKREYKNQDIEEEIPFWEFLDIEFDTQSKTFFFKAHYIQKPMYLELFKELVNSHILKAIDEKINEKQEFRFLKQDWQSREKLKSQIDARNVIYNLIDTKNKLIYIGEAESLLLRLNQSRQVIKEWDFYRFDCLPEGLTKTQRIALERLLIRTFASFLKNKKGVSSKEISEYSLANEKIDM